MIEIRPANSTAPAGDAPVGASRIEIRKKSSEPYYENQVPVSSFEKPPVPTAPEMGAGTIAAEGVKGLARGTLELATSIGGAGVEAAGQVGAGAYDIARAPQTFPGMTPEQFQQMTAARQAQTPTPNPLEGQTQVAQQVYQADRPSLQPDPRTSPENAPYLTTQWGVPQVARLAGEAGSMVPAAAATIGAAAATGGIGPAGALAGGAMGGAIEGLSEYQQVLESGGKPADALRAAAVMGAGSGALNAIPFVAYSTKFLPKGMRNSVGKAMISFLAEGTTETAEGGVSAISRMNKLPKSADEWAEAYRKVEKGVIDESNVFLVAGLMGGGTSMLSKDDTQPKTPPPAPTATEPNTPRYDPRITPGRPEDNTDLDELEPAIRDWLLNTSDQTTIKIKGKTYKGRAKVSEAPPQNPDDAIDVTATPVDALRPGPNAPNAYASFDEDNAPWVPQEPPVVAPEATNAPAPIVPAPEQQVAPEAPVEQLSPEYQALLDENPELAALLRAANQQPTAEQTALEQSILGQDLIDSREAKPPVEVRKPAPPLIEARPALDVGRPVEEQAPEPQTAREKFLSRVSVRTQDRPRPDANRPTVTPEPTNVRATVRNMSQKGAAQPEVPQLVSEPTQQQEDATESRNVQALTSIDSLIDSIAPQGDTFSKQTGKNNIRRVLYETIGINAPAVPDRYTGKVPEDDILVRIGESRLSERKGKGLDSPEVMDDLTRAIMRRNADAQNLDIDAVLGPNSGLNELQKTKLRLDAEKEAVATINSLKRGLADLSQDPEPKPAATFKGMQPRPRGQEPIPLYNIPDGKGGQTTVSAETAAAQGYSVPEPPVEAEAPTTTAKEKLAAKVEAVKGASPVSASANRAAMPEQREGTNYEKTLGAIGDTLAGNKGVVADVTPTPTTIRAAALDIAGAPETRVRLADLREKLGGTREQQDAALLDMQKSGELVLMRNDDPQDITPRDEAAKLMLSGERRDLVYVKAEKPTTQEKVQALREKAKPKPKPKRTRKPKDTPPDITQQSMVEEESAYPESIQYDEEDVAYQYTQERLRKAFNVSTEDAQLLDAIISATGLNPKMLYVAAGSGSQRGVAGVSHSVKMGTERLRAAIIEGRSKSNTEAAIHEIAHAFRYILFDKDLPQSSRGNVTLDDIETARKWAGGKEGYNWGSEAEERFAQGFEKYLSTGKAPSSALERVFERLKQWIDKVYSTVIDKRYKARYDSISITPEMRDVFDRMLGKKEEAKKPKRGGDEAGFVNMGAIKEIGGIVFEAATKPVVFEQGFGQAKPAVAERRAKLKSFEMRGKHIAMDFDNGFRKLYKRLNPGLKGKLVNRFASIPDKIVNQLNDYLEQADPDMKAEALMELPPELREPAVKMRELIDNMTDYMLSLGIVEDEQGMAFADNKGVYLRRTYDIFTDPDFRERRDPRLKETLRKWLQKEYPEYSKEEINGIITDLDGTGLSATSTNNMIARGKALGQMDRRTLGRREDIPQEVMDFWGVSRNGYDRFLDTINSQAHVIANYEFLSNMAENLDGISVATASTLRDIKRGTYTGDNADEIMSWPYLNDADTARSIRRMSRKRESVSNKEQAIATALEKLGKLPDSQKKTEMVEKLRDDALMLKLGLKRDKAGVMSVDPENLEAAAAYLEALTAEVSSLGKKKGKDATKLRKDLDKYTRQYNKAEGEAATDENLPNMFGSFGPLAGARIHPDLKKALQDALAIKERSEFVDALRGINSQMKQNVTTRNPASAVRNLTSGFDFSMANGWILYGNSVKRLGEAMAIANVDISRNHDPKLREWYLRAAELGVAGDTVVIGDITATAANAKKPKKIRDFIRKYPEIAKAMGGPDAVAQKLYQAGDDVFKIFGWLTETEHLMDIGMSRKEAEVEAALRVRNQFPTYSELPKWAQWFKASPVVGPFVAYKTETYRTAYNTVVQAVTEVKSKDPKVRRMGYRRLAGIGAAGISRNALKIMLFAAFAIDPDDEDAIQMAAPVFYQDHTLGIVKANKAKGLYEGYNLSTSDAYNVLKEPMYAALRGEGVGETVSNAAITIGRDYISPEMGASLIAELLANIQGKSNTIFKKSDTAGEKWLKSAMRVGLDVGVPGGARGFLKAETPEDMINETVTQFTGLKTIKIDMPNDLLYKARALTAIPREQATDVYKQIRAKDIAGAKAEIAKVNQTRKEQFMVVHKAYRAYASAGTRTDLLDDALKQAGLSQKSINNVKYGQYEDWEGSKPMKEALGQ